MVAACTLAVTSRYFGEGGFGFDFFCATGRVVVSLVRHHTVYRCTMTKFVPVFRSKYLLIIAFNRA